MIRMKDIGEYIGVGEDMPFLLIRCDQGTVTGLLKTAFTNVLALLVEPSMGLLGHSNRAMRNNNVQDALLGRIWKSCASCLPINVNCNRKYLTAQGEPTA